MIMIRIKDSNSGFHGYGASDYHEYQCALTNVNGEQLCCSPSETVFTAKDRAYGVDS